jgi:hypothetical protein
MIILLFTRRFCDVTTNSYFSCVRANLWFQTAALMSHIYEKYKDEDGFLYITYSGENTFGGF